MQRRCPLPGSAGRQVQRVRRVRQPGPDGGRRAARPDRARGHRHGSLLGVEAIQPPFPRRPREGGRVAIFPAEPAKQRAQQGQSGVDAALLSRKREGRKHVAHRVGVVRGTVGCEIGDEEGGHRLASRPCIHVRAGIVRCERERGCLCPIGATRPGDSASDPVARFRRERKPRPARCRCPRLLDVGDCRHVGGALPPPPGKGRPRVLGAPEGAVLARRSAEPASIRCPRLAMSRSCSRDRTAPCFADSIGMARCSYYPGA